MLDNLDILEGLLIRVVDVSGVWPTLRIAKVIPLGRLEWIWNTHNAALKDSSSSAKAVIENKLLNNAIIK